MLRRDPSAAVGGSTRATEFEVLRAAGAGGVAVPEVAYLLDADDGLGDGFVMLRVEGETIHAGSCATTSTSRHAAP